MRVIFVITIILCASSIRAENNAELVSSLWQKFTILEDASPFQDELDRVIKDVVEVKKTGAYSSVSNLKTLEEAKDYIHHNFHLRRSMRYGIEYKDYFFLSDNDLSDTEKHALLLIKESNIPEINWDAYNLFDSGYVVKKGSKEIWNWYFNEN